MAVRAFRLTIIFFLIAMSWNSLSHSSEAVQRAPQPRRNIGLFFDKLRAGKQATVAYIGSGVTQGIGASDANKTSYRALVNSWLRSRFPNSKINELNSAIGGTTSLYAAIRARRDVVEYKPDLVFLEFAASDASETEDAVKKSIEGIVRQLLAVSQPPEIVMVYVPSADGKTALNWHETIADYYHLPKINLQERLAADNQSFAALSKDGVHPNDEGHKIFAQHITAYLSEQEKLPAGQLVKVLPMPFLSDEMTYGELKAFAEIAHGSVWKLEPTNDKALPASLLSSDKANTEISASFDGTVVGLTFKMGPDAGFLECLIDGKPAPEPLRLIDCYDKEARIGTRIVAGGLSMGEHKLTIRVKGEKNARSTGAWVRLGSFLMGGARPEKL